MVLFDGRSVADADHDAVGELVAQRRVQRELLTFVERRRRLVEEHRPRLASASTRANATRCCSPGDSTFDQSASSSRRCREVAERHGVQDLANRVVVERSEARRIAHHRAQVPKRRIGQLRQEHRRLTVDRQGYGSVPERIGPQLRETAHQRRLAAAGRSGDHQRLSRSQREGRGRRRSDAPVGSSRPRPSAPRAAACWPRLPIAVAPLPLR